MTYKRTIACVLCATLTGAEFELHHRICAAPIQCLPVNLFHVPGQEPSGPGRAPTYTLATGTGTSSSSSADDGMYAPSGFPRRS